jgi:tetratricopeptide (TPR) repeat protein
MAIEHMNYAIDIFKEQDMQASMGGALVSLGNIFRYKGDLDQSLNSYERGLKILERLDEKLEMARAHNNIGSFYADKLKDQEKGIYHYTKCLDISREAHDLRAQGYSLTGLAAIYTERGDFKLAEEYLMEARGIFKKLDEKYMLGGVSEHYGELLLAMGEHSKAEEEYKYAVSIFEDKNLRYDLANTLLALGKVYIAMDRNKEAEQTLTRALSVAEEIGSVDLSSEIVMEISKLD